MEKFTIQGIELTLSEPDAGQGQWLDYNDYHRQLEAAWLQLSAGEQPLNPRLIGNPGVGKTTLAGAVGRKIGRDVYVFQCTSDTRPEDLLITPVLGGDRRIEYRASPVVTAMIRGGLLVLDEGNRMPERSWAALASLMDHRRSIDSAVAAIRVHAHPDFRLCVTMNDDSSVYELPGYIQSRLKPRINVLPPSLEIQERIVRAKCLDVDEDLLRAIFADLKKRRRNEDLDYPSNRDILTLASYAQKLKGLGFDDALARATEQVLTETPLSPDSAAMRI